LVAGRAYLALTVAIKIEVKTVIAMRTNLIEWEYSKPQWAIVTIIGLSVFEETRFRLNIICVRVSAKQTSNQTLNIKQETKLIIYFYRRGHSPLTRRYSHRTYVGYRATSG
jgi:hypothetical protein